MKNVIGWSAAFIIVLAYGLLSFEVVQSNDYSYNIMNLFGGIGLAYRVYLDRNYSNFVLEIIFIMVALKSIFL